MGHAGAISTTRVCLKSAELFYEPSGPSPLGKTPGAVSSVRIAGVDRTLRYAGGSAPARRPNPTRVTFLNGRNSDIFIGWTQSRGTDVMGNVVVRTYCTRVCQSKLRLLALGL